MKKILISLFTTTIILSVAVSPASAQYKCIDQNGQSYSGNSISDITDAITADNGTVSRCDEDLPGGSAGLGARPGETSTANSTNSRTSTSVSSGAFSSAIFIDGSFIPPQCLGNAPVSGDKPCDVNAVMTVVVNVSRLILGTIGSVALLMFIYGGVTFITAAGNTQRVEQGKTILINAVIGIGIVLLSWVLVNTLVAALTGTDLASPRIFDDKAPLTAPNAPKNSPNSVEAEQPFEFGGGNFDNAGGVGGSW